MSRPFGALAALAVTLVIAACDRSAPVEEYVIPAPATLSAEPVFTGKYN